MDPMSVTLDVSRLNGWLNAEAHCRVERESVGGGEHVGKQVGGWGWVPCGASSRMALTVEVEGRARAERT